VSLDDVVETLVRNSRPGYDEGWSACSQGAIKNSIRVSEGPLKASLEHASADGMTATAVQTQDKLVQGRYSYHLKSLLFDGNGKSLRPVCEYHDSKGCLKNIRTRPVLRPLGGFACGWELWGGGERVGRPL
jgi:hypothetical protein